jgi:two-component system heavy metal sensor histidine kinase CusS
MRNRGDTIPPDHIERMFDRFHRVDTSRACLSGGSGLGLAIVGSIMTAHGGQVVAASDWHTGGTVFTLSFSHD